MTTTPNVDPLMLDIPDSLETQRLLIRAPKPGDGPAVNEAIAESLEELRPYMPFAQTLPAVEESERFVRDAAVRYLQRSMLNMTVFDKSTGKLIGCSGLHHINWEARFFEIGYWIRTSCAGQGYMTEAVQAITELAISKLEANRIEIRCDSRNARSAAMAERSGFVLDGILRRAGISPDGGLHDVKVYAKVRGAEF